MTTWGEFANQAPELAAFGLALLERPPWYLATVRASGLPRVHPVTPFMGSGRLFVFMEPTSPKGNDLRARAVYALHNGVPDTVGSGGEFTLSGRAALIENPAVRVEAVAACPYTPAERYILFTLGVDEARCNGYGDVTVPGVTHWKAS